MDNRNLIANGNPIFYFDFNIVSIECPIFCKTKCWIYSKIQIISQPMLTILLLWTNVKLIHSPILQCVSHQSLIRWQHVINIQMPKHSTTLAQFDWAIVDIVQRTIWRWPRIHFQPFIGHEMRCVMNGQIWFRRVSLSSFVLIRWFYYFIKTPKWKCHPLDGWMDVRTVCLIKLWPNWCNVNLKCNESNPQIFHVRPGYTHTASALAWPISESRYHLNGTTEMCAMCWAVHRWTSKRTQSTK